MILTHAHLDHVGRLPLLVGGTMLYARTLLHPMDDLPGARPDIRARLADGTLYQTDLDQAVALQARDGVIEEELMAALERWETLSSHS